MSSDWRTEIEKGIRDFLSVAQLAGDPIALEEITIEFLPAPHSAPSGGLPAGKMAIYAFWHGGSWLKIGKAGPRSHARYSYQHYTLGHARSALIASLVNDKPMMDSIGINAMQANEWIRTSTCRVNVLLPASRSLRLLSLLEAFLHVRLAPRYEG